MSLPFFFWFTQTPTKHHIISWSGGKDSTATVILFMEHFDELVTPGDKVTIIFSEVMYDLRRNISGHNPDIIRFIYDTKKVFESWGFDVRILRSETDYLTFFHHKMKNCRKKPEHEGKTYGFPASGLCGIKRDCKLKPIQDWQKAHKDENVISYQGIAIDEPERLPALHKQGNAVSLLEKYGCTEDMAMELCRSYGLVSPQYSLEFGGKKTKRDGCWFCPNAKLCEFKAIKDAMPDVWAEFVALEDEEGLAYSSFRTYSDERLHDIDRLL